MPFTFSHPALVLPLRHLSPKWLSMTGLIIGSLSPDFEYFIRMKIQSEYSHTADGMLYFCLPLTLILAFLFHNIVRNSLFNNLPVFLKSRFSAYSKFKWNKYFIKHWFVVCISALIGAISHIFWDSFTHPGGYFVEKIPFLTNSIFIGGGSVPILKLLQHISSLAGVVFIFYVIYKLPQSQVINRKISISYWLVVLALTITITACRILLGLDYRLYGHVIVTIISSGLIALVITPVILTIYRSQRTTICG